MAHLPRQVCPRILPLLMTAVLLSAADTEVSVFLSAVGTEVTVVHTCGICRRTALLETRNRWAFLALGMDLVALVGLAASLRASVQALRQAPFPLALRPLLRTDSLLLRRTDCSLLAWFRQRGRRLPPTRHQPRKLVPTAAARLTTIPSVLVVRVLQARLLDVGGWPLLVGPWRRWRLDDRATTVVLGSRGRVLRAAPWRHYHALQGVLR